MNGLREGIRGNNPVLVLSLGLCPALAVSTAVVNTLALGLVVLVALVATNMLAALVKSSVPRSWELPVYLATLGVIVTVIEALFGVYMPGLAEDLGIYLPLTAVNCVILHRSLRVEPSAGMQQATLDAVGMALGFTGVLAVVGLVREALGSGTITLFPLGAFTGTIRIPLLQDSPATVFVSATGAFLVLGYVQALRNWRQLRAQEREEDEE